VTPEGYGHVGFSAWHTQFVLNDDIDHPMHMGPIPPPPIGAHVELGGRHFAVDHVAITYDSQALMVSATVWLSDHIELG
jgi:hypothetical protein